MYRHVVFGCAIASLTAFFLTYAEVWRSSITGLGSVKKGLSVLTGNVQGAQLSMWTLFIPLLMPIGAAVKFVAWYQESQYSHVASGAAAVAVIGYYGFTTSFGMFGTGAWLWLAASVAPPAMMFYLHQTGSGTGDISVGDLDETEMTDCPNCGVPVAASEDFCGGCGHEVA